MSFDINHQANSISNNQKALMSRFSNMQNQFTPGYKAENLEFNDLMSSSAGGAKKERTSISFTQGQIFKTEQSTNLALNGQGFFMVNDGKDTHYSRDGRFTWQDGALRDANGKAVQAFPLDSQGNISGDMGDMNLSMDPNSKLYGGKYTSFHFDETGKLYGESTVSDPVTGQEVKTSTPLYQVGIASFANAGGLERSGTTSFMPSDDSGDPVVGVAGQGALGQVCAGSLEMSNVDYGREASSVQMTKQNYEANMAAFRAMDKLTQSALGLVR